MENYDMTMGNTQGDHNCQLSIINYQLKHGFRTFNPKAVLFDMDGVIFDSMPNHARSWHEAMKQCGIEMTEDEAYAYEGMRGVETIKMKARQQWGRDISDEEAQRMYTLKTQYFADCPPAQKMAGVESLMQKIKDSNMTIGVVTGSGQHTLLDRLEQSFPGLLKRELMVTSMDVKRGKPDPEPYLAGLQKVGVEPWEAIVIENAPLGVRAAVAAHIFTIAVNTGPLPDQQLKKEGANLVVKHMDEVAAILPQLCPSDS
jgi:HAD superfamily hydrolase (TIGR01509 family)